MHNFSVFLRVSSVGIVLIKKHQRINFQIKSKFSNNVQLTIYVSSSTLHSMVHML